jgi:hypothetical protein
VEESSTFLRVSDAALLDALRTLVCVARGITR